MSEPAITLFHAPQTRSTGALVLLEELGIPYTVEVLNLQKDETKTPEYLAVNPMGKVPALRDGAAVVTEQVAIFLHLADRFPDAGLAPAIGDPLRGPYLRWMVFYAACMEPAMVDRAMQREPGRRGMSPYGEYSTVIGTVGAQLRPGPWLLGERFLACDVLWGMALGWMTGFGLVEATPEIAAYVQRLNERPAIKRALARDGELAAAQKEEPASA